MSVFCGYQHISWSPSHSLCLCLYSTSSRRGPTKQSRTYTRNIDNNTTSTIQRTYTKETLFSPITIYRVAHNELPVPPHSHYDGPSPIESIHWSYCIQHGGRSIVFCAFISMDILCVFLASSSAETLYVGMGWESFMYIANSLRPLPVCSPLSLQLQSCFRKVFRCVL